MYITIYGSICIIYYLHCVKQKINIFISIIDTMNINNYNRHSNMFGGHMNNGIRGQNELRNTNGFNGTSNDTYVGNYSTSYLGGIDGNVHYMQNNYEKRISVCTVHG